MLLSASIMCANIGWLAREVIDLDQAGIDIFHMDIMDGEFVQNFALSHQDLQIVRSLTRKKVDVHLMVRNPEIYIPHVLRAGVDIIYVHHEAGDVAPLLQSIRDGGVAAGLAINPETSIDDVRHLLPWIDRLLVMRVSPGFAGQKSLAHVEEKIARLVEIKGERTIGIDGAVCPEIVAKWSGMGVDEFILGTSSLFGKQQSYADIIARMRGATTPRNVARARTRYPMNFGMSWLPAFAYT